MKNRIERILVWFENENGRLNQLNESFFGLSMLLTRLVNEKYDGKKIKFINIYFASEEKYKKYPVISSNYIHYYGSAGGHLAYYGVIDFNEFCKMSRSEQQKFIWKSVRGYLLKSSDFIKNNDLKNTVEFVYEKGISINLNADYKTVGSEVVLYGQSLLASVWIIFGESGMLSKLSLERNGKVIFEKEIDKTKNGIEFFLDMYKRIVSNNDAIVIEGRKDVKYLPLTIPIDRDILN